MTGGPNFIANPWRGKGLPTNLSGIEGEVERDPRGAVKLFQRCPLATASPLINAEATALDLGIVRLWLKDERARLGLGSFKALGATHAIAKAACAVNPDRPEIALTGTTYVCASAGNHGLSMAAGARLFGAEAVVYLSEQVPEAFADRLRQKSATVVRAGADYEASMVAAALAAETNGWQLLSDSTWPGYAAPAIDVMEGYLIMGAECADQLPRAPSHVFLQAGVGGLAAAMAVSIRRAFGDTPEIIIVEPEAAPALIESIRAGRPIVTEGPVSAMGRLDCKEPSHLALAALAREADAFMTISEEQADMTVAWLKRQGVETSPSGAAGIAGLRAMVDGGVIDAKAQVLAILSEGPVADG